MNLKTKKQIAQNKDKTWYLLQSEVAVVLGITRQSAAAFIKEKSIPSYQIGKSKKYSLDEVLDVVERTRTKI